MEANYSKNDELEIYSLKLEDKGQSNKEEDNLAKRDKMEQQNVKSFKNQQPEENKLKARFTSFHQKHMKGRKTKNRKVEGNMKEVDIEQPRKASRVDVLIVKLKQKRIEDSEKKETMKDKGDSEDEWIQQKIKEIEPYQSNVIVIKSLERKQNEEIDVKKDNLKKIQKKIPEKEKKNRKKSIKLERNREKFTKFKNRKQEKDKVQSLKKDKTKQKKMKDLKDEKVEENLITKNKTWKIGKLHKQQKSEELSFNAIIKKEAITLDKLKKILHKSRDQPTISTNEEVKNDESSEQKDSSKKKKNRISINDGRKHKKSLKAEKDREKSHKVKERKQRRRRHRAV